MIYSVHREITINLVKRAEKAGFKALVLTVDTPFFGLRLADIRNKFVLPPHLKYKIYHPALYTNVINTTFLD